ncbi:MAG: Maf family protein [Alcanivoracaceae bacterium]
MRQLWLASASPRRADLLHSIGVAFRHLVPPDIDETPRPEESADRYVLRMAYEKARTGWMRLADEVRHDAAVLGADTTVVLAGRLLGKPADADDARAMLTALSGAEHQVLSAVTVITAEGENSALSTTRVRFATLSAADIEAYVTSGEPMDKAGSYAIQGFGALLVEAITGSYSGVVGLPLRETGQLLQAAGVPAWQERSS